MYYGPRYKDSFEMHKHFVKPAESTYEFSFPRFFGINIAKAFYDSFFADELEEAHDDLRAFSGMAPGESLRFNSDFENGNLDMAVRTGDDVYDLFLRADTNTRGHFGWFHFEVCGTQRNQTVTFNIVNMSKPGIAGMQVNMWS